MLHLNKAGLYSKIANLRNELGLEPDEYGIDTISLCRKHGIQISEYAFVTPGLRGMAQIGDNIYPDGIILNSLRSHAEQNVDCAHECVHLGFHRNEPCHTFKCFEKVAPGQDNYIEWQANEGGAEMVVPYRPLLRQVKRYEHLLKDYTNIRAFKNEIVGMCNVTEAVITFRLESLKYEISQFLAGVPMDKLRILSSSAQAKEGICVKSLNNIAIESYYSRNMNMNFQFESKRTVSA